MQKKKITAALLGVAVLTLGLVWGVKYQPLTKQTVSANKRKTLISKDIKMAGLGGALSPSFSGKPCADSTGSPYPWQGSGNCRGDFSTIVELPTTGVSLVYHSLASGIQAGYGNGWNLGADGKFVQLSDTTAKVMTGGGSSTDFTYDAQSDIWRATNPILSNAEFQLEPSSGNMIDVTNQVTGSTVVYRPLGNGVFAIYQVKTRIGTLLTINRTNGLVTSLRDRFNKVVALGYSNGILTSVTDQAGSTYSITYDGNGNLTQISYPDGNKMNFAYTGNLLSAITNARNQTTQIAYFDGGVLKSITDSDGLATNYAYTADSVHVQNFFTDSIEEFVNGVITSSTTNNATTTYVFDDLKRLVKTISHLGLQTTYEYVGSTPYLAKVVAGDGTVTEYTYDSDFYSTGTKVTYNGNSIVTETTLDAYKQPVSESVNGITAMTYSWDAKGNLLKTTDGSGNILSQATYTAQSLPGLVYNIARVATTYVHDASGNLTSMTLPTGEVITYTRNALGLATGTTSSFGSSSTMEYDALGTMLSKYDTLSANGNKLVLGSTYDWTTSGSTVQSTAQLITQNASFTIGGNATQYDAKDRVQTQFRTPATQAIP